MTWLRSLFSRKARLAAEIDAALAKRKANRLAGIVEVCPHTRKIAR